MDFWKSLSGMIILNLTSADPAASLTAINRAGITAYNAVQMDSMTFRFVIRRGDYSRLAALCAKRGDTLKLFRHAGLYWRLKGLLARPFLLCGIAILLILVFFLPTRIYFVKVEGNVQIPDRYILEEAEHCGISFGASRSHVRSERVKNALLSAIPELQWAGVNTSGCIATISVRERTDTQPEKNTATVTRIVALRDGVIRSCTVTRGNSLCQVGQAVRAGEVLVSGYTDCGLCVKAQRAQAEIYAETERTGETVTPAVWSIRGEILETTKKYGLILGKKRINFFHNSGILDTTCAKIYEETCLTLPGGFELPIRFFTETWTRYRVSDESEDPEHAAQLLGWFTKNDLTQHMIAGRILSAEEQVTQSGSTYRLSGKYACLELIGQEENEEIQNGKTN